MSVWIVGDFEKVSGRKLLLNALKHVVSVIYSLYFLLVLLTHTLEGIILCVVVVRAVPKTFFFAFETSVEVFDNPNKILNFKDSSHYNNARAKIVFFRNCFYTIVIYCAVS